MTWVILVVGLVCSAWGGSSGDLDARDGFRDLVWGSAPAEDMVEADRDGELVAYTRPDDELSIGEAVLESLSYFYWRDQLYTVYAVTDGLSSSRALLGNLKRRYGQGTRSIHHAEKTYWHGSRVVLSFGGDPESGKATAIFLYKPVHTAREQEEAQ